mgnify:CR=1 FL=1|tara:strand:+ start:96 stop:530 length:435 start_codon:yes stop_codon:yes gene_type:complete
MAKLQDSSITGSLIVSQSTNTTETYPYIISPTSSLTAAATISVNFSGSSVFTLTPDQNTLIDLKAGQPGLNKTIIVKGSGGSRTINFAADTALSGSGAGFSSFILLAGEYDDTALVKNFMQFQSVGATGSTGLQEIFYSISQPA